MYYELFYNAFDLGLSSNSELAVVANVEASETGYLISDISVKAADGGHVELEAWAKSIVRRDLIREAQLKAEADEDDKWGPV